MMFLITKLPYGQKFNASFFISDVLEVITQKFDEKRPKKKASGVILHFDNSKSHTANVVEKKFQDKNLIQAPHPPFSPDLAPNDFWFYGFLKEELKGYMITNEDEMLQAVFDGTEKIRKLYFLTFLMNGS